MIMGIFSAVGLAMGTYTLPNMFRPTDGYKPNEASFSNTLDSFDLICDTFKYLSALFKNSNDTLKLPQYSLPSALQTSNLFDS
ncbi:uncharacterized protein F4822DRAFT_416955 [Hypoxylon trugodes]|uniref:uncharacterized protein n=1 Tax=Hypoxylon trugodes TaxID=326681 RepID=UPI00219224C5|nr:uncharacterized protein F4822DRAFT_416955 [Hypoxylon trugodes]KAI1384990.1 hypothetical protein F4822DRAFT_416955 [Hypoxylon trugodes]